MKKKRRDSGQLTLSFGMIFSIILIVIFIAFAFFAIKKFLEVQDTVEVGKFATEFQADIDRIWQGSQGSEQKTYSLSKSVEYLCFSDYTTDPAGSNDPLYAEMEQLYYENENMFFYPPGSAQGLDAKEIKHIDLDKITEFENPFCIKNTNGKVTLTIKKSFGETLVTINR